MGGAGVRVAAKLDGVGERDAASNDARPGLLKPDIAEPYGCTRHNCHAR